MVQVSGTTYRIVSTAGSHAVFRIDDDRRIGVFLKQRTLRLLECDECEDELRRVAKAAFRAGRLPWSAEHDRERLAPTLRSARLRALTTRLLLLWPAQ